MMHEVKRIRHQRRWDTPPERCDVIILEGSVAGLSELPMCTSVGQAQLTCFTRPQDVRLQDSSFITQFASCCMISLPTCSTLPLTYCALRHTKLKWTLHSFSAAPSVHPSTRTHAAWNAKRFPT